MVVVAVSPPTTTGCRTTTILVLTLCIVGCGDRSETTGGGPDELFRVNDATRLADGRQLRS